MNLYVAPDLFSKKSRVLTAEEVAEFGRRVDAIRAEVHAKLGKEDSDYIYKVRDFVRYTEIASRGMLMVGGWLPPVWLLATAILGVSKIVENMELGHNVMHGQFNFMNDPQFHGDTFDWDNTCPKEEWRHSHNYVHHTWTNVIGKDRDFGYGMLRLSNDLRWSWLHPFQLLLTMLLAVLFFFDGLLALLLLTPMPSVTVWRTVRAPTVGVPLVLL